MKLSNYLQTKGRGSKAKLARDIRAHASDLSDWMAGKRPVPLHRCTAIEMATAGAVSRKDLRPTDWHIHWPELAPQVSEAGEACRV